MTGPGPRNLITDVAGLAVGNADDARMRTGVTAVMAEDSFVAAVDIRGGAPGTRDVAVLSPENLVDRIHAVCLSGGSAYGNDAPGGVQTLLRAQGKGFQIAPGAPPVPVVCGAILFDLANGGDKDWGEEPPYRALAQRAAAAAGADFALGNAGAGYGAIAGAYKGGLGSASWVTEEGFTIGALAAVNPVGSPVMPGCEALWAWPFEQGGEFGGRRPPVGHPATSATAPADLKSVARPGENTTIAVIATDAALDKLELRRIAIMAADGFARALRPVHTPFDGDLVFALSTARHTIEGNRSAAVLRIGLAAGDCMARAIARGVYAADSLGTLISYRDRFGGAS